MHTALVRIAAGLAWAVFGVALEATPAAAGENAAVKVRLYPSLVMGHSAANAKAFTEPMTDLVAAEVSYPIALDVETGNSVADLRAFGEKLSKGEYHLGAVWGIEYGWMHGWFPDLKPIVWCYNGRSAWECRLLVRGEIVRKTKDRDFRALKGIRLVRFEREPLMYPLSLDKILKDEGFKPDDFFQVVDLKCRTVREAVIALYRGEADCMMIDIGQYTHLERNYGKLIKDLEFWGNGPFLPPPVVIGRPENLDKLRPGLWREIQSSLVKVHDTEEGRACITYWRLQRFEMPQTTFDEQLSKSLREFPLDARVYGLGRR